MKHALVLGATLVMFGCGKAAKDPGVGSGSATPVVKAGSATAGSAAGAGSGSGSAAKSAAKTAKATAEQKTAYRKQMKAGWAAQKDKKWADAATAFAAALVAVPNEQRALAELGWSAMNAGDYKRAKVIDQQVVATAHDKKVKASGYFNLGQVQEKLGDKPGALRSYAASIALRPNKTVEAALLALGADPKKPTELETCAGEKSPCDCLKSIAMDAGFSEDDDRKCTKADPAVGGTFHEWRLMAGDSIVQSALFDAKDRYVADLAMDSGARRMTEVTKVEKIEVKTIGAHEVLWIERSSDAEEHLMNDEDTETTESIVDRTVTLCVIGEPTTCPIVDAPLHRASSTEHYNDDPKAKVPPDTRRVVEVTVTLGDDGAEVKLVQGSAEDLDDKLLGPHKLW